MTSLAAGPAVSCSPQHIVLTPCTKQNVPSGTVGPERPGYPPGISSVLCPPPLHSQHIITARKRSCGNIMVFHLFVSYSVHKRGVSQHASAQGGVCGRGVCVNKGCGWGSVWTEGIPPALYGHWNERYSSYWNAYLFFFCPSPSPFHPFCPAGLHFVPHPLLSFSHAPFLCCRPRHPFQSSSVIILSFSQGQWILRSPVPLLSLSDSWSLIDRCSFPTAHGSPAPPRPPSSQP